MKNLNPCSRFRLNLNSLISLQQNTINSGPNFIPKLKTNNGSWNPLLMRMEAEGHPHKPDNPHLPQRGEQQYRQILCQRFLWGSCFCHCKRSPCKLANHKLNNLLHHHHHQYQKGEWQRLCLIHNLNNNTKTITPIDASPASDCSTAKIPDGNPSCKTNSF